MSCVWRVERGEDGASDRASCGAARAAAPLALVALYSTPLTVVSCRTRGLLALGVALAAAAGAFVAIGLAVQRLAGAAGAGLWWLLTRRSSSTSALALLLGPLG